jgi:hypothetical protein
VKNRGGSAFPWNDGDVHCEGVTVRQYYKAAALAGNVMAIHEYTLKFLIENNGDLPSDKIESLKRMARKLALAAGEWADQMIAEDEEAMK